MRIFRTQSRRAHTRHAVEALAAELDRLSRMDASERDRKREAARAFLVELGALEAAAEDARWGERDGVDEGTIAWRNASREAAHLFIATLSRDEDVIAKQIGPARDALDVLRREWLPEVVEVRAPEGYSQYGLYPETYVEAAWRFAAERAHGDCVCIGLRGIGTSLSAAVGAALECRGRAVHSITLRPRGEPFERRVEIEGALAGRLRELADRGAIFLVVDEGPGLSGSSLGGAAAAIEELGVPAGRIVLFPSWLPPAHQLLSSNARERWARHDKYLVDFEDVFDCGELLDWVERGCELDDEERARRMPLRIVDASAGAWRGLVYRHDADHPAVHPQHERRKFIALDRDGRPFALCKFTGFGSIGESRRARSEALAAAGFGPPVIGSRDGFLAFRFVPGTPMRAPLRDRAWLNAIAEYLAFVAERFDAGSSADVAGMENATRENLAACLGDRVADRLPPLSSFDDGSAPAVILDGRMLPHEWIRTERGYLKTDSSEHGDDQFFPGPHDIAWDLAAACVELRLDGAARAHLIDAYRERSGDRGIERRLVAFELGWRAFRMAYATLAARTLGNSPDGRRFRAIAARHAAWLRGALAPSRPSPRELEYAAYALSPSAWAHE